MEGLEKTLTILSGTDHVLSQMLKKLINKEGFLNFMSNKCKVVILSRNIHEVVSAPMNIDGGNIPMYKRRR